MGIEETLTSILSSLPAWLVLIVLAGYLTFITKKRHVDNFEKTDTNTIPVKKDLHFELFETLYWGIWWGIGSTCLVMAGVLSDRIKFDFNNVLLLIGLFSFGFSLANLALSQFHHISSTAKQIVNNKIKQLVKLKKKIIDKLTSAPTKKPPKSNKKLKIGVIEILFLLAFVGLCIWYIQFAAQVLNQSISSAILLLVFLIITYGMVTAVNPKSAILERLYFVLLLGTTIALFTSGTQWFIR